MLCIAGLCGAAGHSNRGFAEPQGGGRKAELSLSELSRPNGPVGALFLEATQLKTVPTAIVVLRIEPSGVEVQDVGIVTSLRNRRRPATPAAADVIQRTVSVEISGVAEARGVPLGTRKLGFSPQRPLASARKRAWLSSVASAGVSQGGAALLAAIFAYFLPHSRVRASAARAGERKEIDSPREGWASTGDWEASSWGGTSSPYSWRQRNGKPYACWLRSCG